MSLTVGSLFAGVGGFDLAAERVGFQVKWQVEIDDYCTQVLEKHWPHVRRYRDVRRVHGRCGTFNVLTQQWGCDQCLDAVDIICAGFPCNDLSVLGGRAGLQGEHSGLWRDCARVVRGIRPRAVLVENTPSLLVNGMGDVLGDFSGMGYDAEWAVIPAAAVGSPQLRARLWILAYPARVRDGASTDPVLSGWATAQRGAWWETEPGVGRVADGIPAQVDRLRTLGGAIVPQVAEWIFRQIAEAEGVTV